MKVGVFNLLMNNYIQIEFQDISTEQAERLIAELNEIGFEGFEEVEKKLSAFISAETYNESQVKEIADKLSLVFSKSVIEETNWNEVWEANFQPVVVNDFVGIRADFHQPITNVEHEIIITPKMSFGTGHHATTYMIIQQMREIDFTNKSVFDFGTGTGVLAILAEKLGAKKVLATDNDEWSINNATENIEKNNCTRIELRLSSEVPEQEKFDVILANINKNVILANLPLLYQRLKTNGILLLSGLLAEDEKDMLEAIDKLKLKFINKTVRSNWLSLRLSS